MKKLIGTIFLLLIFVSMVSGWGFWAHQQINRLAVFTLPTGMIGFYKSNINYITVHAVDPDKRRYADPEEAPRHYLDADHYGKNPFDSIPKKWKDAVAKYGEDTLKAYGIVPWHIERMMYRLTDAFKIKDSAAILRVSAELGHYIGDAHVPLHTTENYNGQMTNQVGIHGFWESRLPEMFAFDTYDFYVGKPYYIEKPLDEAWKIVKESHYALDSVLLFEKQLTEEFGTDKKYSFIERNGKMQRDYSDDFSTSYHTKLDGMVERRMRAAIRSTASFWYTAWVNAGQPELKDLLNKQQSIEERQRIASEEKLFKEGKIIGRPEPIGQ